MIVMNPFWFTGVSAVNPFTLGGAALFVGPGAVNPTIVYTFSSNSIHTACSLPASLDTLNLPGACGTSSIGLIGGGQTSSPLATTTIITFATNTNASGANLKTARYTLTAAGNATLGVFGGGYGGAYLASTDVYTYSGNTDVSGTNLSVARTGIFSAGNSTVGVFRGGNTGSSPYETTLTDVYTYSGNTVTGGAALSTARYGGAGCGTTLVLVYFVMDILITELILPLLMFIRIQVIVMRVEPVLVLVLLRDRLLAIQH
jgi:hypothetical protein